VIGPALSCFLQWSEHRREGNDICTALPRYDLEVPAAGGGPGGGCRRWQQKQQTKRGFVQIVHVAEATILEFSLSNDSICDIVW
jgi:hypothetical protein